jgi:hypothetical protein
MDARTHVNIYIPKVKLANSNITYVFLGPLDVQHPTIVAKLVGGVTKLNSEDEATLEHIIGKKWEKTILWGEKDVNYVNHRINHNDTVHTFRKKLGVFLGLKNPYIWYDRQIKNDPAAIYHFVNNTFRKSTHMRSDVFIEHVKNILGCVCLRCSKLLIYKTEKEMNDILKNRSKLR